MSVSVSRRTRLKSRVMWLLPLALAGVGLVLYSTPYGLGLGGDSFYYVSGARNLVEGLGFARPSAAGGVLPITHFPPLYAVLLAGPVALGFDAIVAARWLSAALFGASLFLAGLILQRGTRSTPLALGGQIALLSAPVMLTVHSWVLSESVFHFLLLATIWQAGRVGTLRLSDLVVMAALASMAFLTRYVHASLIAGCAVVVALAPGRALGRRVRDAVFFVAMACVLPALWLVRNYRVGATLTNRAPAWHPVTLDVIRGALDTVSLWVLPGSLPVSLRAGLALVFGVALLGAGAFLYWRKGSRPAGDPQAALAAQGLLLPLVFGAAYALLLMTSLSVFDAATPTDARILSPFYPVGVLTALIVAGAALLEWPTDRTVRWGAGVLIGLFLLFNIREGYLAVRSLRSDGQGYAGRFWADSALIRAVRELPGEVPIYSNELDAIYLLTGRAVFQVPIRWDPVLDAPRMDYPEQLARMRERLTKGRGALVLFASFARQEVFLGTEEDLTHGLRAVLRTDEGVLYSPGP